MEKENYAEAFVQNLLLVLPNWHAKLVRPFKEKLGSEMSLETYYCLETLKICKTATMTEMSQRLKVPKQQVTKLADRLCEHGFIERVYDEHDRRITRIRLTEKAVSYTDLYYLKNRAFIEMLNEQLTGDELKRLNDAVAVLGEILPKLK